MKRPSVVILPSVMLFFFTVPHNIEDFAYGEPARFGLPPLAVAFGLSAVLAAQGLALAWTGAGMRRGYALHAILGFAWAIAAVVAHVGEAFLPSGYRAGFASVVLLAGIVVVGGWLGVVSLVSLRRTPTPRADRG